MSLGGLPTTSVDLYVELCGLDTPTSLFSFGLSVDSRLVPSLTTSPPHTSSSRVWQIGSSGLLVPHHGVLHRKIRYQPVDPPLQVNNSTYVSFQKIKGRLSLIDFGALTCLRGRYTHYSYTSPFLSQFLTSSSWVNESSSRDRKLRGGSLR